MITIYQAEWCPYCKHVREWISENLNHVPVTFISEPHNKPERKDLIEMTGQNGIPSLVDDETQTVIADDDDKIIEYLAQKFVKEVEESEISEGEACPLPGSK